MVSGRSRIAPPGIPADRMRMSLTGDVARVYPRDPTRKGCDLFGSHHLWAQMKTDVDDPDLLRPGGFERQVRGRILGSLILIAIMSVVLVIVSLT
ncbi:MAG: hypothetical protein R6U94_05645 [Nitriliruptoraceae bacterium]